MARLTKTAATKPIAAATAPAHAKRRSNAAEPAPVTVPPAKTRKTTAVAVQAPKAAPASTRVPPPSKGELRAQIEKLEAANGALKAKGREANRNAKAAVRRVAELEEQVSQLQAETAKVAASVAPPQAEAKTVRRGRPPGRKKAIDPGDAVPPGVAVHNPEPLDQEAAAARDALEENLSGE